MTDAEKQNLVELLDSLVMAAVPKSNKVAKYGGTLYTLMPDEKEGRRKFEGRRVNSERTIQTSPFTLQTSKDVDAKVVKRFVKAASKLGAK